MKSISRSFSFIFVMALAALVLSACGGGSAGNTVEYTLSSTMVDGTMAYVGVGGNIDGVTNPALSAQVGQTIKINFLGSDMLEHDISLPDFNAASEKVLGSSSSSTISFTADKAGEFDYFCTIPGHREGGMAGKFTVTQ